MRTADQLFEYEAFMRRGAEVGFLQALDEVRAKAHAEGQRDASQHCEGICCFPVKERFSHLGGHQ